MAEIEVTGTLADRFAAIEAGHQEMMRKYLRIMEDEGAPPSEGERTYVGQQDSTISPAWQQWYHEFLPIKDQMYALAYELGIPFEMGGQATSDEYAAVWEAVQLAMTAESGNRRQG